MLPVLLAAVVPPPPPVVVAPAPPPLIRTNGVRPAPSPITRPAGTVPARAVQGLGSYITDDDYPAEAARRDEQGTVGFQLDVGPDGRVVGCTITASSGSVLLDSTTCRLLRTRARFEPARDPGGGAVADSTAGRIRWKLPPRVVPDQVTIRFAIGPDGITRNCRLEARNGAIVQMSESLDCAKPAAPPAQLVAALRRLSKVTQAQVRQETFFLRDGKAPWPEPATPTDLVALQWKIRLMVAPDGKVQSCTVLDSSSSIGGAMRPCRNFRTFSPVPSTSGPAELRGVYLLVLEGEQAPR